MAEAPHPILAASLVPHRAPSNPSVRGIEGTVTRTGSAGLRFEFLLDGHTADLRVPESLPPSFRDGLWRHTCFEAFVAIAGSPAYREFNFSPSGEWAGYRFSGYRQREGGTVAAPEIVFRQEAGSLHLNAAVTAASLPPTAAGATLQIGLAAVIESVEGNLSYWALAHPAEQPDFHHRDGFLLSLSCDS